VKGQKKEILKSLGSISSIQSFVNRGDSQAHELLKIKNLSIKSLQRTRKIRSLKKRMLAIKIK
jgi:hypothetical protein